MAGSYTATQNVQFGTGPQGQQVAVFSPSAGQTTAQISIPLPDNIAALAADGSPISYSFQSYIVLIEFANKLKLKERDVYHCIFNYYLNGMKLYSVDTSLLTTNQPFYFSTSSFIMQPGMVMIITQELVCLDGPYPQLQVPPPTVAQDSSVPASSVVVIGSSSPTPQSSAASTPATSAVDYTSTAAPVISSSAVLSSDVPTIAIPSSALSTFPPWSSVDVTASSSMEPISSTLQTVVQSTVTSSAVLEASSTFADASSRGSSTTSSAFRAPPTPCVVSSLTGLL